MDDERFLGFRLQDPRSTVYSRARTRPLRPAALKWAIGLLILLVIASAFSFLGFVSVIQTLETQDTPISVRAFFRSPMGVFWLIFTFAFLFLYVGVANGKYLARWIFAALTILSLVSVITYSIDMVNGEKLFVLYGFMNLYMDGIEIENPSIFIGLNTVIAILNVAISTLIFSPQAKRWYRQMKSQ